MPLPRNVKVLSAASLLNDVAGEMIFPLLPSFLINVLGGNKFYLGIIEGAADSVASILKLWSGAWSDRAGRRKGFVVVGYALTVLFRPLIGLVVAPWQLLCIRVSDRLGKGIRVSPRDAMIADSTSASQRGRAFGFNRAMDHLGAAIGPLLAASFLYFWPEDLSLLFLLTIVPGLAVLVLLVFLLRETPPSASAAASISPAPKLTLAPFNNNFRLYLLALFVFTLGNSSDAFLLLRAQELGVPLEALALLWAVFHIAKSTSNILLGRAVDVLGPRPLMFAGWLLYAAVYLGFALATSATAAWVFFLVYALYYGLTEPSQKTLVAQLVGPERKGLAYGWYNFAIGVGTLPASVIFGAIYQSCGPFAAFAWGAGLAFAGVLILALVRAPKR